jgi:hypothetical protein
MRAVDSACATLRACVALTFPAIEAPRGPHRADRWLHVIELVFISPKRELSGRARSSSAGSVRDRGAQAAKHSQRATVNAGYRALNLTVVAPSFRIVRNAKQQRSAQIQRFGRAL